MSRVPRCAAFPPVAAHPDLVRLRHIGTARLGEPLRAPITGDGPDAI
ncbi:hypothetical protein ACFQYP_17395 [Nonomuraea antimicrobica]